MMTLKTRATMTMITLVLLGGCVSAQQASSVDTYKPSLSLSAQAKRALMIGQWYGSSPTKEGGRREWIVNRSGNGSFLVRFRVHHENGVIEESVEVGEWGVSGPVYFTLTKGWIVNGKFRPADLTDGYFSDAYELLLLDAERMEYRSYASDNRFSLERVPEGSGWPRQSGVSRESAPTDTT